MENSENELKMRILNLMRTKRPQVHQQKGLQISYYFANDLLL